METKEIIKQLRELAAQRERLGAADHTYDILLEAANSLEALESYLKVHRRDVDSPPDPYSQDELW